MNKEELIKKLKASIESKTFNAELIDEAIKTMENDTQLHIKHAHEYYEFRDKLTSSVWKAVRSEQLYKIKSFFKWW
jgi:hypothetical protein